MSQLPAAPTLLLCLAGCASGTTGPDAPGEEGPASRPAAVAAASAPAAAPVPAGEYPVAPPPFSEGIFPCSACHADLEPDATPRPLEEHKEIALDHGPREHWCFECHNPRDRDRLRLASGKLIAFSESYRLCGQCHGDKLRDWKVGVHGKRTGHWDGPRQYLLCASCHNPHSPRFKPIKPLPPPRRPLDNR